MSEPVIEAQRIGTAATLNPTAEVSYGQPCLMGASRLTGVTGDHNESRLATGGSW